MQLRNLEFTDNIFLECVLVNLTDFIIGKYQQDFYLNEMHWRHKRQESVNGQRNKTKHNFF